jgi:hypothetical protein
MNSLLPNLRFICLPSENLGLDWFEKAQSLDNILTSEGLDLAEEAVYLLFSEHPSNILESHGQCLIARSVIGAKKELPEGLKLIDWKAAPVWREAVTGEAYTEILEEVEEIRTKAQRNSLPFAETFILRIRRKLSPKLVLLVETIFHE